jgi:hypothetical protein
MFLWLVFLLGRSLGSESGDDFAAENAVSGLDFQQELHEDAAMDVELLFAAPEELPVGGVETHAEGSGHTALLGLGLCAQLLCCVAHDGV